MGEENNKKTLEKVRKEQNEVKVTISKLDRKHQELDDLLERCKKVTVDQDLDVSVSDGSECGAVPNRHVCPCAWKQCKITLEISVAWRLGSTICRE